MAQSPPFLSVLLDVMEAPFQHTMNTPLRTQQALHSGFEVWTPTAPRETTSFEVVGHDYSQVLEVQLLPGELVTAEPKTMLYAESGITFNADVGGVGQGCTRCCCAGESFFRLHLQNSGSAPKRVALTPSFPAKIVPVDLASNDGLVFNSGAFLAALGRNWRVNLRRVRGIGACCCAGQGLFMNTLHGDGMVFLNAGGTVLRKVLAAGEELIVDKHGVLAFESTVTLSIERTGGCMVCCCAGQGLYNAKLTGPGFVLLHSMSLNKLRGSVMGAGGQQGANAGGGS